MGKTYYAWYHGNHYGDRKVYQVIIQQVEEWKVRKIGTIYNNADGYRWYKDGIRAGVILHIHEGDGVSRVYPNSGECTGNRGGGYPQDGWWKKYNWKLPNNYPYNRGGTWVRYRY